MNILHWVKPLANLIAIFGFATILAGVLAYQNYPVFSSFAKFNCELGYYGLFMVLIGFGCSEWSSKYIDSKKASNPRV